MPEKQRKEMVQAMEIDVELAPGKRALESEVESIDEDYASSQENDNDSDKEKENEEDKNDDEEDEDVVNVGKSIFTQILNSVMLRKFISMELRPC